jgi:competence protein ComEC
MEKEIKITKASGFYSSWLRRGLKLFLSLILLAIFSHWFFDYLALNSKLEVDFLAVGQGDATLIKIPGGVNILIDAGPDNLVLRRLGEKLKFSERTIDLVIISHYHDDHASGLVELLKRYKVKKIIYSDYGSSTPLMKIIKETARGKNVSSLILTKALKINFTDDCFLDLLSSGIFGVKNDGNNSLITKLDCRNQKFLFTGDNSLKVEKVLINSGWDLSADVFKASHHGSNSANSEIFLRAVNPKKIIISVGKDNRFGHPSPKVLERAAISGITVYRTDQKGTIYFYSKY